MTADLTAFLRACIDDDERLALAVENSVGTHRAGEMYDDGSGTATNDAFPSYPWGAEAPELSFMAGPGHPARVLADVQAKRAILDEHKPWRGEQEGTGVYCSTCVGYPIDSHGQIGVAWPCRTVRLLMLPLADHVDYQPEWRP